MTLIPRASVHNELDWWTFTPLYILSNYLYTINKDRQYTDITYWYTYRSRKTRFLKMKHH